MRFQKFLLYIFLASVKKIRKQTIEFFGKNKKRIENKSSKKLGNKTSLKSTLFLINHTECIQLNLIFK